MPKKKSKYRRFSGFCPSGLILFFRKKSIKRVFFLKRGVRGVGGSPRFKFFWLGAVSITPPSQVTNVKKRRLAFFYLKQREYRIIKRPIIYIVSTLTRFSIDTFYFGLKIHAYEATHLLEFINYYLFWYDNRKIEYNFSKNRFYQCQYCDSEHGFNIFFRPRKNVKNDYICFELTGKFFKDIAISSNFLEFILETFEFRVNFQRLDIAIDLIYDSVENVPLCENTHLLGFPFPRYSNNWRFQRIPFEMYGRIVDNCFYINMVFQGKNDVRLRVYDKELDLMDKYKTCYSEYYCLNLVDKLVYRIELQMRSDKLKNYIDNFIRDGLELNVFNLICSFVNYIFDKYTFENIDFIDVGDVRSFSTYVKREPDILKRIDYYRKYMFKFYEKYLNAVDEYEFFKRQKTYKRLITSEKIKNSLSNDNFSEDKKVEITSTVADDDIGYKYFDFYQESLK